MIQDILTRVSHSIWPQIFLVILVLCFVGIIIWTYRGRKDRFREEAALPLDNSKSSEVGKEDEHGE